MSTERHPWFTLATNYCEREVIEQPTFLRQVWEARKVVLDYVWARMRTYGETSPPFLKSPETSDFVRAQRVTEIRGVRTSRVDGHIVPDDSGFTIFLKDGLPIKRRRTVIAHEIGHTFFYDLKCNPPSPLISDGFGWKQAEGPAYEIGRQILVPEEWLIARNQEPTIKNFFSLQEELQVSAQVLARRLMHDLRLWDVFLLFSGEEDLPDAPRAWTQVFKGQSFKNFEVKKHLSKISHLVSRVTPGQVFRTVTVMANRKATVEIAARSDSKSYVAMLSYPRSNESPVGTEERKQGPVQPPHIPAQTAC